MLHCIPEPSAEIHQSAKAQARQRHDKLIKMAGAIMKGEGNAMEHHSFERVEQSNPGAFRVSPDKLLANGHGGFTVTAASGPAKAATGFHILQGALEGSNVDMGSEMVTMMSTQRNNRTACVVSGALSACGAVGTSLTAFTRR
jgi:flagellar basal body rod protein FlgG